MSEAKTRPPSERIVTGLAILLVCQLAGETTIRFLGLAVDGLAFPGPVIGMAYLFAALLIYREQVLEVTEPVAKGILANLSLLFVPAAVGIIQYGSIFAEFGLALIAALLVSTVLTLIVTVMVFIGVRRLTDRKDASEH